MHPFSQSQVSGGRAGQSPRRLYDADNDAGTGCGTVPQSPGGRASRRELGGMVIPDEVRNRIAAAAARRIADRGDRAGGNGLTANSRALPDFDRAPWTWQDGSQSGRRLVRPSDRTDQGFISCGIARARRSINWPKPNRSAASENPYLPLPHDQPREMGSDNQRPAAFHLQPGPTTPCGSSHLCPGYGPT